jgi:hypothetical protein
MGTSDQILKLLMEVGLALVDLVLRLSNQIDAWGITRITQIGLILAILYEIYLFTQGEDMRNRLIWIPGGLVLVQLWYLLTPLVAQLLGEAGLITQQAAPLIPLAHAGLMQASGGFSRTLPDLVFNGPVIEEVFFRLPILLARRNGLGGYQLLGLALLSSIIFSMFHGGATISISGGGTAQQATALQALGFGLIQCYLVYLTESPLVVFVVHIINNAL